MSVSEGYGLYNNSFFHHTLSFHSRFPEFNHLLNDYYLVCYGISLELACAIEEYQDSDLVNIKWMKHPLSGQGLSYL